MKLCVFVLYHYEGNINLMYIQLIYFTWSYWSWSAVLLYIFFWPCPVLFSLSLSLFCHLSTTQPFHPLPCLHPSLLSLASTFFSVFVPSSQLNVTALDWTQLSKKECVKYGGSLVGKSCKYVPDLALMSFILFFGTYTMTVSLKKFKFNRYFPTKVRPVKFLFYFFLPKSCRNTFSHLHFFVFHFDLSLL